MNKRTLMIKERGNTIITKKMEEIENATITKFEDAIKSRNIAEFRKSVEKGIKLIIDHRGYEKGRRDIIYAEIMEISPSCQYLRVLMDYENRNEIKAKWYSVEVFYSTLTRASNIEILEK